MKKKKEIPSFFEYLMNPPGTDRAEHIYEAFAIAFGVAFILTLFDVLGTIIEKFTQEKIYISTAKFLLVFLFFTLMSLSYQRYLYERKYKLKNKI